MSPGATEADVIVVGSGPAGYTAALYLARANLAPVVFEGSVAAGGALQNTTAVDNFPGFPDGVMGPDLMARMRAQAERFQARLIPDDVVDLDLAGARKTVRTEQGELSARAVVLAMGSSYRELGLPDESRLSGRGVSWCATCDGFFFRGRTVVVVGGGDSAVEEATFLTRFAEKVYLVHRRDRLRASAIMVDRLVADPKVEVIWNAEVTEIVGDDSVEGVVLRDVHTGERRPLRTSGLFVAIGHEPRSDLIRGQVAVDPDGYVVVAAQSTATSSEGVFAAGDLVDRRYRQAVTAAGSGCAAALDTERFLARPG